MSADPLRCLLIADFTIAGLGPFLTATADPPALACTVAPFDLVVPVLLDGAAECWAPLPDLAIVWTQPHHAIKAFARLVGNEPATTAEILGEVDEFAGALRGAAKRVAALFVPTWTWPAFDRGLGVLNHDPRVGPAYHLLRMNARLADGVAEAGNIFVLDAGRWVALAGAAASSPKLWHLGKIAFGPDVFKHAAADIKAGVRAARGASRKLVVLDLDETLWGGIVGDAGWENVALGGHDPIGEAYVAFQRDLKALSRRGIVLAIVSKNTEAVALEAVDRHPEMVLRRDDFVGWRINWEDKARNIIELVAGLNLGLESVVFIDDNPAERARVREALPQVAVPEWPRDPLLYSKALAELTGFDTTVISVEDRARTGMYVADRRRDDLKQGMQSLEEYLRSLGLRVTWERLAAANLPRATQLLNKTNQMNLTTRRLTEPAFLAWAEADGNHAIAFRVADRFGDYGLVGLASLTVDGETAEVVDFVLSCRVMGRGVESVMLHCLATRARAAGADRLAATYRPTARNVPCRGFFESQSGFVRAGEEPRYEWSLTTPYALPEHIALEEGDAQALPSDPGPSTRTEPTRA